ncbi:hypothetical protein SAMN03097715_01484 [Pseudomonas putida]|nr:hypothetical protein SAMN03097715_01484 [Pseudomonas putida]
MHEAVFVKDTCHQRSIGECQFVRLVGNRLISIVQQLKLDKRLFFQELREKASGRPPTGFTHEGIGRPGSDRRSAGCLRAYVCYIFSQTEHVRSTRRYGITAVNRAGICVSYQSNRH